MRVRTLVKLMSATSRMKQVVNSMMKRKAEPPLRNPQEVRAVETKETKETKPMLKEEIKQQIRELKEIKKTMLETRKKAKRKNEPHDYLNKSSKDIDNI